MFTSHDEEDNIPVNMPDLIRKRFGYNQRAARIGPDRIYARSDFPHPFQLRFSKEGRDHIAENRPGSDLDSIVRV